MAKNKIKIDFDGKNASVVEEQKSSEELTSKVKSELLKALEAEELSTGGWSRTDWSRDSD